MPQATIGVIGLGYVGLTTGVCFASRGWKVIGYDIDEEKVEKLARGLPTFYESGLDTILRRTLKSKKFVPTSDKRMLGDVDVLFLCVGTPSNNDGSANLSFIRESSSFIASVIRKSKSYKVVCIKSTVPPCTAMSVVCPILENESGRKDGEGFGLCSNPEFLREGNAIEDTLNPDKVVIGCAKQKTLKVIKKLYQEFYRKQKPPIFVTTPINAELIKYANNAFLATKISFINSIARLCQSIPGGDVEVVAKAIGMDRRIGSLFLKAGLGYGGSCFPKDVKALISLSSQHKVNVPLLNAVHSVNEEQPMEAVKMVQKVLGDLKGKVIAILGLAFKPDTDDMREAVSVRIINKLLGEQAIVKVHDPLAVPTARKIFGGSVEYFSRKEDCIRDSDCVIIVTEWKEYSTLSPRIFSSLMREPLIIDGRRVLSSHAFSKLRYYAIGLGQ